MNFLTLSQGNDNITILFTGTKISFDLSFVQFKQCSIGIILSVTALTGNIETPSKVTGQFSYFIQYLLVLDIGIIHHGIKTLHLGRKLDSVQWFNHFIAY